MIYTQNSLALCELKKTKKCNKIQNNLIRKPCGNKPHGKETKGYPMKIYLIILYEERKVNTMKDFNDLYVRLSNINGMMYATEGAIINSADMKNNEGQSLSGLFYILWEQLKALESDIQEIEGHTNVCNAIFAVNHVEELKEELACLKNGIEQNI